MNWSSLLPYSLNPLDAFNRLFVADHNVATHGLRDLFIFLTFGIAISFGLPVLSQTLTSWLKTGHYLRIALDGKQAADLIVASNLPFFRQLRHHLIEFSSRDGSGRTSKRRTVDAAEVFRESALAPAFSSSR